MMFAPITSWSQSCGEKLFSTEDLTWIKEQTILIETAPALFFSAFSLCARRFKPTPLAAHEASMPLVNSQDLEPVWTPVNWSHCTLARALLIIESQSNWATFDSTFATADLKENIDLYKLLHIYDQGKNSSELCARLSEGLRTNTLPIFTACAFNSNLPAKRLKEDAWNQMILKALFLDLDPTSIVGQTRRKNEPLDLMLLRYASEKAHASREIPHYLWDLMQSELSQNTIQSIKKLSHEHPNPTYTNFLQVRFHGL